jgi:hypothetical protein
VTPTPKKNRKSKKHTGYTLDSFTSDHDLEEPQIQIFTDSKDRVPEADPGDDNPFYGEATNSAADAGPQRRTSKRRKVLIDGEGELDISDAVKRDDGAVYVL